jgi:uncharacterized protein YidB (DUF937 family)
MDMNNMLETAAKLFQGNLDKEGNGIDLSDITAALSTLMADNDGNVDIASMVSNLNADGLTSMAASWLGDGENETIAPEQVKSLFDGNKISDFAASLGLDENSALSSLSNTIPDAVDQSSSGGSLLDSVGGISGAMGLASKLFGR